MTIDYSFITPQCQLSPEGVQPILFEMNAIDLFEPHQVQDLLILAKEKYEADDFLLPVSSIGLSLFGLLGTQWIIFSQYQRILNLNLSNIILQIGVFNETSPYIFLKLKDDTLYELETNQIDYFSDFIQSNIVEPIEVISKVASIKPSIVYNQFGSRATTLANAFLQRGYSVEIENNFSTIYNQLKNNLPSNMFNGRKNPFLFKPIFIENPYEEGKNLMVRSSCCMFYKKKNGVKCYSCPALSKKAREEMRKNL